MSIALNFLSELQREAVATRALLNAVPMEKRDWKPHAKSMTLGRLATHIAEIPSWFKITLEQDVLDFAQSKYQPVVLENTDALLLLLEKNLTEAEQVLKSFPEERFAETWTMRQGDMVFFSASKEEVVRTWCLNHWYHHRAQLGVYLRLLEVALPGTYGPSAG